MARQTGEIKLTGTAGGLCFYKLYDGYFVRTKSSLTSKRFWKDRAFEGSRKSCSLLAGASRLASLFYKTYPREKKRKGIFNEMTGRVKRWLKEGKTEQEALLLLKESYPVKTERKTRNRKEKRTVITGKNKSLFTLISHQNIPGYQRKISVQLADKICKWPFFIIQDTSG